MNNPGNKKIMDRNKADIGFGTLVTKPSNEPKPSTPQPKPKRDNNQ